MSDTNNEFQRKVRNRLRRASGQLDAVIKAVDSDASCREVITQLAAVTKALNRAGFLIVSEAMNECLSQPDGERDDEALTIDELEKIFLSLA